MQLVFEQIRSGGDRNFGYLLGDREARTGVLIDPSYSPETFVERANAQSLSITHVINTHSHPDHTNGNERALALTGAALAAHPMLRPGLPLDDGAVLTVGALRVTAYHVPGHCPDHMVLYESVHRLLITGDLLFVGKVGGTQNDPDARTEWHSLQRLLQRLRIGDGIRLQCRHDALGEPRQDLAGPAFHDVCHARFRHRANDLNPAYRMKSLTRECVLDRFSICHDCHIDIVDHRYARCIETDAREVLRELFRGGSEQ